MKAINFRKLVHRFDDMKKFECDLVHKPELLNLVERFRINISAINLVNFKSRQLKLIFQNSNTSVVKVLGLIILG